MDFAGFFPNLRPWFFFFQFLNYHWASCKQDWLAISLWSIFLIALAFRCMQFSLFCSKHILISLRDVPMTKVEIWCRTMSGSALCSVLSTIKETNKILVLQFKKTLRLQDKKKSRMSINLRNYFYILCIEMLEFWILCSFLPYTFSGRGCFIHCDFIYYLYDYSMFSSPNLPSKLWSHISKWFLDVPA